MTSLRLLLAALASAAVLGGCGAEEPPASSPQSEEAEPEEAEDAEPAEPEDAEPEE